MYPNRLFAEAAFQDAQAGRDPINQLDLQMVRV